MQKSKPKYACLPRKIVKVWIERFCVRYDWWRRLQPTSSVSPVWYIWHMKSNICKILSVDMNDVMRSVKTHSISLIILIPNYQLWLFLDDLEINLFKILKKIFVITYCLERFKVIFDIKQLMGFIERLFFLWGDIVLSIIMSSLYTLNAVSLGVASIYRLLSSRPHYLHCWPTGTTTVLH